MRKETVDIDIIVTSRNGDRKTIQSIRITTIPTSRIRKWNRFSQFRWTSAKGIPIDLCWLHFDEESRLQERQQLKGQQSCISVFVAYPSTPSINRDMTTVFHTWLYGKFMEIENNLRRKKLHRTNQGSNFLGGSFSNRDNVRALIQFRRESQPQSTSISTSVIRPVKWS